MTQQDLRNWIVDLIGEVTNDSTPDSEVERIATQIMGKVGDYMNNLREKIREAIDDAYYSDEE